MYSHPEIGEYRPLEVIIQGDNVLPKPILKQQNSSTALIDKHIIICISIISCY